LAKDGIAVASPLNFSFVYAKRQHRTNTLMQIVIPSFDWEFVIGPTV